jgi:hypothetical protein
MIERDTPMIEENAQRSWHFKQLRWSLQNLANAGSGQASLFPDYVRTADELAMEFEHWSTLIRSTYDQELSAAQLQSLEAIEQQLRTMSRDGAEFDLELWTDAAVRSSELWAEVRQRASIALESFN